jgi:hypothetical protein
MLLTLIRWGATMTSQLGSIGQIANDDGCLAAEAFYLPGSGF